MSMSSESSAFPSGALGAGARRLPSLDLHVADLERQLSEAEQRIAESEEKNATLQKDHAETIQLLEEAQASRRALMDGMRELREQLHSQRVAAETAQKREAEAREGIAELKDQLYRVEIENARLSGYLDRVSEDDAAREEPRVFQEPRVVPRRPPPMRSVEAGPQSHVMAATDSIMSRPRRHWTRI